MAVKIKKTSLTMWLYQAAEFVGVSPGRDSSGKKPASEDKLWPFHDGDVVDMTSEDGLDYYLSRERKYGAAK